MVDTNTRRVDLRGIRIRPDELGLTVCVLRTIGQGKRIEVRPQFGECHLPGGETGHRRGPCLRQEKPKALVSTKHEYAVSHNRAAQHPTEVVLSKFRFWEPTSVLKPV